jgi:membrane protein DedA with SNARE-associated domain
MPRMLESLLTEYGYPILLIGTFLEGETILILGGVAAHIGYLSLKWVIICGFLGTLFGDQIYFYLGRHHGTKFLARHPVWQTRSQRVYRIMERHPTLLVLGFRFLYGIRTVTPFVIGMSNISYLHFALLNTLGAGLWAVTIGLAGFYFSQSVEAVVGDIKLYEIEVLTLVAVLGALAWVIFLYRRHKRL